MIASLRYPGRFLFLLLALILPAAIMPAPAAQAVMPIEWSAWNLKVDFPNNQLRVLYTFYTISSNPAGVEFWSQEDISTDCRIQGALSFDGDGYARFDGQTAIRCRIPPQPPGYVSCSEVPFWAAADVKLKPVPAANPLIEGVNGGNSELFFNLPSDGTMAQGRVQLLAQAYNVAQWAIGANNQVLLGSNGRAMVNATDLLAAEGLIFLDYMGAWQNVFKFNVSSTRLGQLVQPAGMLNTTNFGGAPWIHPADIFIGYSPTSGAYFNGALKNLEIDPPGCRGG